jgi:colicin import membrane protein
MAAMHPGLFSLRRVTSQEDTHIRDDEESQAVAAELAAFVAERSARQRALAQARVQAEVRAREEAVRLAEATRFEAMRLAAIDRARAEAEMRARVEALTLKLEHERAMRALQADVHPRWLQKVVFFAGLGAAFLFGAGLGAYVSSAKPALHLAQKPRAALVSPTAPPVQSEVPSPAAESPPAVRPDLQKSSAP